uniref:Uncharacterized protein n=1 Tax=Lepeophtheirus salmonis TaxID=72036 RepID=A0A0K2T8G8_LEPSM
MQIVMFLIRAWYST